MNMDVVKAAEDAASTYWQEANSDSWDEIAERFFQAQFESDASPGGPCAGVSWGAYRTEVAAALKRRALNSELWRPAPRDVTGDVANPPPALGSKNLSAQSGELEVDITVTIDGSMPTGTATLTRQRDGRFAPLGERPERWLSAELLSALRSLLGSKQFPQVLRDIEHRAVAMAAGALI